MLIEEFMSILHKIAAFYLFNNYWLNGFAQLNSRKVMEEK